MVCRWYDIEGFRFGIRTTSHAFSEWIDYVLGAYRSPRRADDSDNAATYSVVIEPPEEDGRQRKFHILYLGGWDIVRTLDLGFMAECVYRDLESILYPIRDDYVFLEVGHVDMAGALGLVTAHTIPALNRSARRGRNYGVSTPGGVFTPLELGTGLKVMPAPALSVPADALDSLGRFLDVPARTQTNPFPDPRPVDLDLRAGLRGRRRPTVAPVARRVPAEPVRSRPQLAGAERGGIRDARGDGPQRGRVARLVWLDERDVRNVCRSRPCHPFTVAKIRSVGHPQRAHSA